jgi:hypothetical protein
VVLTSAGRMRQVIAIRWLPSFACAALLAALPFVPFAPANDKKADKLAAEALLAKSRGLSNIEEPGSPPFVLNAKIHYQVGKQEADGQAQIIWTAPDHYREAFTAPNYSYTEIVRDGYEYLTRTNDEVPLVIYELQGSIHRAMSAGLTQKEKIKDVDTITNKDQNLTCVKFSDRTLFKRCFDSSGDVVAMERDESPSSGVLAERYEFHDFVDFGAKRFPQNIVFRGGDNHTLEMNVEQLASIKSVASDAFVVPAGAMKEAWCAEPKIGSPQFSGVPFSGAIDPGPAMDAVLALRASKASLYLEIGSNGRVRNVTVLQTAKPIKDTYLKSLVNNMRYPPRLCGNEGTEYQMEISFTP